MHRAAECLDVAEKHKLVSNKSGKAPTMRLARAAMLFASRLLAAQPSNAWKQRSYPALWSAMLGAFHAFYLDDQELTSRDSPMPGGGSKSLRCRASASLAGSDRQAVRPPYNLVGSGSPAPVIIALIGN